jgi:rare lipoprotein A
MIFGQNVRFVCVAHRIALSATCLALAGCAGNNVAGNVNPQQDVAATETPPGDPPAKPTPKRHASAPRVIDKSLSYSAVGTASWYGADFHGRPTANGETYNMHSLTAAHRTLPLQCTVKVTNLANNRSLMVRVNDRGPFKDNRLIDLSAESARLLGFYDRGLAKVKVELVNRAPKTPLPPVREASANSL